MERHPAGMASMCTCPRCGGSRSQPGAEVADLHPPQLLRRDLQYGYSGAAAEASRPVGTVDGASMGMVEDRSGLFRAGSDAVFKVLETGRCM